MIYINNITGEISTEHQNGQEWENRNDWKSYERAVAAADFANVYNETDQYIAIDNGRSISPRYDVIAKPAVNDEVSYGFNGDYYPDGKIKSISKTLKVITTTTGNKYYRRGNSGCWKRTGGTWSLVQGHISRQNPHI